LAQDGTSSGSYLSQLCKHLRARRRALFANSPTWDRQAREWFRATAHDYLHHSLGMDESDIQNTLYVEGSNPIPSNRRGPRFLGRKAVYPDAALIDEGRGISLCIELDHGRTPGRIKNALAKASFAIVAGAFKQALVLFVVEPEAERGRLQELSKSDEVVQRYASELSTFLYII